MGRVREKKRWRKKKLREKEEETSLLSILFCICH